MADTQRSTTSIYALLADNTSGAISAQDLRDAFLSWHPPMGEISVLATDAAAVTIPGTANYYEVTNPVWTLNSVGHLFDESDGNGRLTYTGTVAAMLHIAATISFTCASNNQVIHSRLGINGTTAANGEVIFKIGTGADVVSTAIHLVAEVNPGDHISLWVRNETSAANITVQAANIQCMGMVS